MATVHETNITGYRNEGTNITIPRFEARMHFVFTNDAGETKERDQFGTFPDDLMLVTTAQRDKLIQDLLIKIQRIQHGIDDE